MFVKWSVKLPDCGPHCRLLVFSLSDPKFVVCGPDCSPQIVGPHRRHPVFGLSEPELGQKRGLSGPIGPKTIMRLLFLGFLM